LENQPTSVLHFRFEEDVGNWDVGNEVVPCAVISSPDNYFPLFLSSPTLNPLLSAAPWNNDRLLFYYSQVILNIIINNDMGNREDRILGYE